MSDHRPTRQCPCGCARPSPHDICADDYERWPCTTIQSQIPLRDRVTEALGADDQLGAVMRIVADLAEDLDHAERENRRLAAELAKLKR